VEIVKDVALFLAILIPVWFVLAMVYTQSIMRSKRSLTFVEKVTTLPMWLIANHLY